MEYLKKRKKKEDAILITREISAFVYDLLKEYGICNRCRASYAKKDHVLCEECLRYWREK